MEETIQTPGEEVKAPEGSVEAEVAKVLPQEKPAQSAPESVPLSVYLELKNDFKELKKEIKEANSSDKSKIEVQGLAELSQKYPDVSQDFIRDMLGAATQEAQKKIEEKYTPIIQKQEEKLKQEAFDKAFDNLFNKALQDNPDLPKNVDKDLVKELALTPKYRNVPLSEVLVKLYGNAEQPGRSSSENDTRPSADFVSDTVDFGSITDEQKKAIMADPDARSKYFNWLDTQPGR